MKLAALNLAPEPAEEFRSMIHDEVDKWVDLIIAEAFVDGKKPTLSELSELFAKTKKQFFGACLQALIEKKYAGELDREYAPCPKCGKMCKLRRADVRQIVSMQGSSALKRPWFYCVDCSYGFSPLDQVLELSRKKYQFDVQHKATRTSAEVPFFGGSDLFAQLTDQPVSDHFMHDTFEAVGAHALLQDVIPEAEQIADRCRQVAEGSWRPVLVVASDGAQMPGVGGKHAHPALLRRSGQRDMGP
jgi:hypothetical protein